MKDDNLRWRALDNPVMMGVMPAYLDDQPLQFEGSDLHAALKAAREQLGDSGRMIVEAHLDGQVLAGDEIAPWQTVALGESELRLYTADVKELVVTTLQQTQGLLEEAKRAQNEAADLLQKDLAQPALHHIRRALDAWGQTHRAVAQSLDLLNISLEDKIIDEQAASEVVTALVMQLKDLRASLERRDTVALADALAYEWPQNNDRWAQLITHMIDWARGS